MMKHSVKPTKETRQVTTLRSKIIAAALIGVVAVVILTVLAGEIIEDALAGGTNPSLPLLTNVFSYIVQGALSIISTSGYYGIFALMLLESSSLPVPSEVILPFSGYLASQGHLNLWLIILTTTLAALAGSLIDYYLGQLLGLEGIKRLRYLPIREKQLESAVKWFDSYGPVAVFGSRLIPLFRTLISFPAGIVHMKMTKFLSYTALGSLIWNTTLAYAGFYAGAHWQETVSTVRNLSIIAIVVLPLALVLYYAVIKRRRKSRIEQTAQTHLPRDPASA